jgi:malate dehydrogenase (oxaloacetate-decarboxylating)
MSLQTDALELHRKHRGKLAVVSKVKVETALDLSLAYSPGVAEPCKAIAADPVSSYDLTNRGNTVAVVTNGTAVLGLGNIGPEAALPVMEGKAILFKQFAAIDAYPICLATAEVERVIEAVKWLEPTFGAVNLEDISGPQCFEIENALKTALRIPVFHDDQHGTAVVCSAALENALKVAQKDRSQVKVVINGAGAAGIAIAKMLINVGVASERIRLCDRKGLLYPGSGHNNKYQEEMAVRTNPHGEQGSAVDVLAGADVFIGVSAPAVLAMTPAMVRSMAPNPIIFALGNPTPDIMPDEAWAAGALVVGTGRSDLPNQINNLLGFPGIFRGTLAVRAAEINEAMKVAAAQAIAGLIPANELSAQNIIPKPLDRRVVPAVALAVAEAAMDTGVARSPKTGEELQTDLRTRGLL